MSLPRVSWHACLAALLLLALLAGRAQAQAPASNSVKASGSLVGANEVPPKNSAAKGVWNATITGNTGTWTLNVTDIQNLTMAHLHLGTAGKEGPVVVPLIPLPGQPSTMSGGLAMLATPLSGNQNFEGTFTPENFTGPLQGQGMNTLISDMRGGQIYVNVHTTQNPGGEIRDQVAVAA